MGQGSGLERRSVHAVSWKLSGNREWTCHLCSPSLKLLSISPPFLHPMCPGESCGWHWLCPENPTKELTSLFHPQPYVCFLLCSQEFWHPWTMDPLNRNQLGPGCKTQAVVQVRGLLVRADGSDLSLFEFYFYFTLC